MPGIEVRVAGENGETMPAGEAGEVLVRGYNVMKAYFENPQATAETIDSDGWLHTGDVGRIDEDGFLYVQGRTDEMIITGGENVIPAEVEDVLVQHPEIIEAAVVGRPDPKWQQAVTAVVVTREGSHLDLEDLRIHCDGKLAPYKIPKQLEVIGELPKTPSGKLHRAALLANP